MGSRLKSKPSWLDIVSVDANKTYNNEFGFDKNGMWIYGNAYNTSYPIRTAFSLNTQNPCEVIYTINHSDYCSDHSVAFFSTDNNPQWSWGTNSSRVAISVNCPNPAIYGQYREIESNVNLDEPRFYTFKINYEPSPSLFTVNIYQGKHVAGDPIETLILQEELPQGTFKIGFDADLDEGDGNRAYFTYLKISSNGVDLTPDPDENFVWPKIEFEVQTYTDQTLLDLRPYPDSLEHVILNLQNRSVLIDHKYYKHGDKLTFYGQEAFRVKQVYVDSPNPVMKINSISAEPLTKTEGSLYMWGSGAYGRLGTNSTNYYSSPVQTITNGTNWQKVSMGYYHTGAIKADGTLWLWGSNYNGQLGTGDTNPTSSPVQTALGGNDWASIELEAGHSAAIKTNGTLWMWGWNQYGQLGTDNTSDQSTPVQTISNETNWVQVACGYRHTAAIKTDGTLWCWGEGSSGELGTNDTITISSPVQTVTFGTDWKQVSCGFMATAAIKTDGTLWTWGVNFSGQLGTGDTNWYSSPVQTICGGSNWSQVWCGYSHMAAIKTDGTLWSWGNNYAGKLGDGTTDNKSSPVQEVTFSNKWREIRCGYVNSIASQWDGTLWVWGANYAGNLGNGNTQQRSSPCQTMTGGRGWISFDAGGEGCAGITF